MKEVSYTFTVPDFCPEPCEAFSPFDYRANRLGCLNETKCKELWKMLRAAGETGGSLGPGPRDDREGR